MVAAMLFMVLERFRRGPKPVYERLAARGRMLPDGLEYVDSWIDAKDPARCFQLMQTDDPALFEPWIAAWDDLAEFEVVPVLSSAEAASRSGRP
jgi:Protein of unknown function (DUF3303)